MLGQLYWIHAINCLEIDDSVSHYRRNTGSRQFSLESPVKTNEPDYKYLCLHEDWLQASEYNYCIETE